jgi:alkylation response protein AidB-like acyl-CoA dehydrogenase
MSESRRDELLDAIREHAETWADAGIRSEEIRTLPAETAGLLADLGFFWLKTPAELGGTPLTPLEFCDVIEELAYADASVAWAAMIGAGCNGLAGGWLPGAARAFAPGKPLPVVAGQLSPRGTGMPVTGGYDVSGRWGFSSGITHADWLIGAFKIVDDSRIIVFTVPKSQAEVIDNWHVAGLQGTGSLDWRVESLFVPSEMTYELGTAAPRGGDLFRLGMPAFVSNEVPPWCAGVARRALDDMTSIATRTARFPGGPTVSERAVFHKELGRAEVRLRAARLAHRDAMACAWETAVSGSAPSEEEQIAVTSASVYAVETCFDVVSDLFRYGGGRVLSLASPMQRHVRNLLAARQHLALSEESYETAGRFRLESAAKDLPG